MLITKYKKLRNQINCKIRKESIAFNEKRVDKANSDGELWKVVNEVIRIFTSENVFFSGEKTLNQHLGVS